MQQKKYLFIDRDGTILIEPSDQQIDCLSKFAFVPGAISALAQLQRAGFTLVLVSNQDGLGTASFREEDFAKPQDWMLSILRSEGVHFEAIRICPHFEQDNCNCRKPQVGLILDYLVSQQIARENSFVIGDRESDMMFANNMGIKGIQLGSQEAPTWSDVVQTILVQPRTAYIERKTKETAICVKVDLDNPTFVETNTGIGFFDHMLMQLASHGGFGLSAKVQGDLEIDDHHTVEDFALTLGQAIKQALGDKRGINRYGFLLPMDEALAQVAIDLSGRGFCDFQGRFEREKVGELSTECVPHFFDSFAQSLGAAIHISIAGENTHHMVEAIFKAVGKSLRQAIARTDNVQGVVPSTKGIL